MGKESCSSRPLNRLTFCLVASAASVLSFARCLCGPIHFTNFDDDRNYERNVHVQTLSVNNLLWSFTDGTLIGVYEPVSNVLKMLLGSVAGISPRSVVTTNVLLHACAVGWSVALSEDVVQHVHDSFRRGIDPKSRLKSLLPSQTLRPALLASAVFFGCHPMRAETVAWASCMPYLHAALFLQLSLSAHLQTHAAVNRWDYVVWRIVSFAGYALACFCKAPAVTFVGVLVILDACCDKLRSPHSGTLSTLRLVMVRLLQRSPELAVAFVAVWTAMVAASTEDWDTSESSYRIVRAALAVLWYLWRAVFPHGLTCRLFCPRIIPAILSTSTVAAVLGVTGLLALRVLMPASAAATSDRVTASHQRIVTAALAWGAYLLLLLPTLGLVSAHIVWLAAERYSYLPMLFVGVPFGGAVTAASLISSTTTDYSSRRQLLCALGACAAVLLGLQTWSLSAVWADSETLWVRTLVVNPTDHAAMGSLGNLLLERGQHRAAEEWQRRAVAIRPHYAPYRANLGNVLNAGGHFREAHEAYLLSIEFVRNGTDSHPKSLKSLPDSFYNLGLLYLRLDRDEQALQAINEGIKLSDENRGDLLNSKGYALTKLGRGALAIGSLQEALLHNPTNAEARNNLVRGVWYCFLLPLPLSWPLLLCLMSTFLISTLRESIGQCAAVGASLQGSRCGI